MTAFQKLPALTHLASIFAGIEATNPYDGAVRALSIDPRRSMILMAPAGSGKTTQLLLRLLACLTVATRPEEILAITFTNKAAREIVERVVGALVMAAIGVEPTAAHEIPLYRLSRLVLERDKEMGWNLSLNPSRLQIMTFDSYCARLAAMTPIMSGLGGGRTSEDPSLVYREAILETLGSVNDESIPEDLRSALEAVLAFAKNRFELLVPMFGSLLAKRDQWVGDALNLDIETMSNAVSSLVGGAATDAQAAIYRSGMSDAIDLLQRASGELDGFGWAANPTMDNSLEGLAFIRAFSTFILTGDNTLRAVVNVNNGMPAGHEITKAMNALLKSLKGTDASVVKALVTAKTLPDSEYPEQSAAMAKHLTIILRYLMANLMLAFDRTATVDFPEVAQRAIQSLGNDGEIGEALLEEDRIRHLLVDEAQDTSPSQHYLLLKLIEAWEQGDDRTVFFCADRQQSIYLFRGATPDLFNQMVEERAFGPKELEIHHLVVNFRSAPAVVEWNNNTYEQVFGGTDSTFVRSVPFRDYDGGVHLEPITSGPLGEAARVVEIIQEEIARDPEQSIAILVRGRSHLKDILPALKSAGISASGTDIDPIADSQPVSEVIALIRALWHDADKTSWITVLRAAFVGLSWEDILTVTSGHTVIPQALGMEKVRERLSAEGKVRVQRLLDVLESIKSASRGDELVWAARSAWVSLGGVSTVDETEMEDVNTVFSLLLKHTATGDLVDPQAFFNAVAKLYASPKAGQVQIMTIHKSKGLEFDCVIMPGMHKGSAPDDKPLFYWRRVNGHFVLAPNLGGQDDEAPESRLFSFVGKLVKTDIRNEINRLAYVGNTRAVRHLYMLGCVNEAVEGKATKAPDGSLLSCVWGAVGDVFSNAPAMEAVSREIVASVPSKARLDASFKVELPTDCFIPAATNDSLPTENELEDELRESEGHDFRAKTIGIVYHRVVELISKEGGESWTVERLDTKTQAFASMLRREGFPIREIPGAVRKIHELVATTLNSTRGRWLLQKREEGGQEVKISGYRNGRWIHRILDRPFVDDGCYWINDWKTPACPDGMSVEDFVAREVRKYAAKMNEYKQAAIDAGVTLPIRLGLFLAAVDVFVEILESQGGGSLVTHKILP
ncbi:MULTISPECIES: UvrD-helicase domain-containing protein [Pseudomonas]|nr:MULTISPECIES: UvrD-helicase domain-containing protein [Pseudomonas]